MSSQLSADTSYTSDTCMYVMYIMYLSDTYVYVYDLKSFKNPI